MHAIPKEALARFKIIAPFLEDGLALPEIARHHDIPVRTLRRWVSRYRQGGISALERSSKASAVVPEPAWKSLAEALALEKPKRSIAGIHKILAEQAVKQDFSAPAYATVRSWLKKMEPALLTLAHKGRKAYNNKYDLIYRRPGTEPNAIWQADHTLLDIWVLDEYGRPCRPWLSIILDDLAGQLLAFI
jgi:putative transposase